MQSGWVGVLLVHEIDESLVLLKREVRASQALATHHAWVCCERSGEVICGGCTCMARQGSVQRCWGSAMKGGLCSSI